MDDDAEPTPPPRLRDKLWSVLVLFGLMLGIALTLGWWTAIAVGLYRAVE